MRSETAETISARTRYCAVYGHPVKHSASPAMHNAAFSKLGLDWRYLAFDVKVENLREAIAGAQAMKFIGLNLTVPHKLHALGIVTDLDESARIWGAVNTVLFEAQNTRGEWKPLRLCDPEAVTTVRSRGFNTDADAIINSIEEDLHLKVAGASILLLGAGGAGRTAALKLASAGARQIHLINRTASKAAEVADEIRSRYPTVGTSLDYPNNVMDLVVNATSVGLRTDDPLPLDSSKFSLKRAGAVYDMIYRPVETKLLKEAAKAGCRTANGTGMLLHQGAKALEIWTGEAAPLEVMRAALREHFSGES